MIRWRGRGILCDARKKIQCAIEGFQIPSSKMTENILLGFLSAIFYKGVVLASAVRDVVVPGALKLSKYWTGYC